MLPVISALLLLGAAQDGADLKARLREPAQVLPVFQELVRAGRYGRAHELLSGDARQALPYEAFLIAFTSFEASRRLLSSLRAEPAGEGRLRLCSPEFGVAREVRLGRLGPIHVLDFTPDDLEHLKGRALDWHRRQVERADGWHFAYPPDWSYAPLARNCGERR